MKLYMILPRIVSVDHYEEVFHLFTDKDDAIFEAQRQNKIRPATYHDVFEIETIKVYDGQEG